MRTIIIRARVPDEISDKETAICLNDYNWEVLQMPTDEEIENAVDKYNRCGRAWVEGATWLKSQIIGE